jgi:TRAP-type C4-dicarboxylate transport system substrate-binding protein
VTANPKSWTKFPGEVRKVIRASVVAYRDHTTQKARDVAAVSYKTYKAKGGYIHVMSASERAKWARAMPNVAKGWAAAQNKKGLPGTAILTAYMDAMRAAKQPILRHWDRE